MTNQRTPLFDDDAITVEILSRAQVLRGHGFTEWIRNDDAIEAMQGMRAVYEARIAELEAAIDSMAKQLQGYEDEP